MYDVKLHKTHIQCELSNFSEQKYFINSHDQRIKDLYW